MKLIYFFAFFLLTADLFSQVINCDSIPWTKERKLTWNDFKAKADSTSIHGAISNVGISYKYIQFNDTLKVELNSYFKPCLSWTKFDLKSDTALIHEQSHFDITELYKRILVKRLLDFKFTKLNFQNKFKEIFADNRMQKNNADDLYDIETDFHRNSNNKLFGQRE